MEHVEVFVLDKGDKERLREWFEMMKCWGRCALSDMAELKEKLPEIEEALSGALYGQPKRHRHAESFFAQSVIKIFKVRGVSDRKLSGTQHFLEDLEECLRHGRRGIAIARLIVRITMSGRGDVSFPRSPGAIRHRHLRQVSSDTLPARLAT
jgi:hypothetical protein